MRFFPLAALLAVASASAQPSSWSFPASGATVALSAERPLFGSDSFGNNFEFGPITSVWRFETSQPIGPLVRVTGEIPFAFASFDLLQTGPTFPDIDPDRSETERSAALGNVQLGVETDFPLAPVTVGGYLRLPTATSSDEFGGAATFVGIIAADEQVGAFIEDVVTVGAAIEGRPRVVTVPGLSFRLRLAPHLLIDTDEALIDDVEGLLGYTAQVFFSSGAVRVGGGLAGVTILTEDTNDRSQVAAGILADAGLGPFRAGATARLPIAGGLTEQLDAIVGLRLTYGID